MGPFAEIAIADYRLLFAPTQEIRKCAVSIFHLQNTNRSGSFLIVPFSIYTKSGNMETWT